MTAASKLGIDHMIPLAEAWGPVRGTFVDGEGGGREEYANDQGQLSSLVTATTRSNLTKEVARRR
ncbi:hypothetical protein [Streptomyces sp. NPDC002287]